MKTANKEIWRKVKGFEDSYKISNAGRLKRLPTTYTKSNGRLFKTREKIVDYKINNSGLKYFVLTNELGTYRRSVRGLLLTHFSLKQIILNEVTETEFS